MSKAVFLDRDGTLCVDHGYMKDPAQIQLYPGVVSSLRQLASEGFHLVIVTNQSGIARGYISEIELVKFHQAFVEVFQKEGVNFSGFYFCPHLPESDVPSSAASCECRKPKPGLILRAASELGVDLAQSYMVGDKMSDIIAGRAAGCRSVLISCEEPLTSIDKNLEPDYWAHSLEEAVSWILMEAKNEEFV